MLSGKEKQNGRKIKNRKKVGGEGVEEEEEEEEEKGEKMK
jgi:hypothetical protein